ncbi:MAG: C10 family peptidase [Prevotella sp.]|nr:C10 family peptidase [Prevotella sp.]
MKRHLFIILCLLCALHLRANPVTVDQARQKAAAFFQDQQTSGARRRAPAARQLRLAAQGRDATYYIYNAPNDGDGYVVVSGDDATTDILGYSNIGTINPDHMPCGLRVLLDGYADQIAFLRKKGITREQNSPRKNAPKKELGMPKYIIDEDRRCHFDQDSPYNDSCLIVDGKPSITGCTATALASLMYAYKWPKATTNEIPSYHNNISTLESLIDSSIFSFLQSDDVEAIPAYTRIDWSNILPQYAYYTLNEENKPEQYIIYSKINDKQKAAVATLMKLAGNSIKTTYTPEESEAFLSDVPIALKSYFGYDDHVFSAYSDNYYRETWRGMLRDEILNRGPVLYRGTRTYVDPKSGETKRAGHAFLLEGFEDHYFYVNFGWSSYSDGKYLLDVFEGEGELLKYNVDQGAVFQVRPVPHTELEVTDVYLDQGDFTEFTITETLLQGRMTFHNKGEGQSIKPIFVLLKDIETEKTQIRIFSTNISPGESSTYNFSFNNLIIGHHYVLLATDIFGEEFYHSAELQCVEAPAFADAENDNGPMKLTRFEYWFDDNFKDIRTATLTKSESVVRGNIATDNLEDGFHLLHFRVKRNAGDYQFSSVNTTPFLKLTKEQEGHLDYWIDDNRDGMKTLPLADTEDEQLLELDLSDDAFCSPGFHRLNIQVATKGSVMGSVQSQGVLKLAKGVAGELEYWFDNDVKHSQKLMGKRSYADDGYIYISELDLSGLTPGQHRLNFRAVSSTGLTAGSVLSCTVMKLSTGKATQLEYWFDDDTANRYFLDGTADGDCYVYDYMLDMSDLPFGLHRLNIRPTSTDGSNKGSLVTSNVLKVGTGSVKTLEYWFDGDIAHSRTLGVQSGEGADFVFADDLNLNGIAPGHHRLYCRAIGDDPTTTTAIVSYAVVVKLRYGADGDATMASYSLTLDNDSVVAYGQLGAKSEVVFNYTLDASELAEGTHTLKATFWNSFGASVTDVTPFWVRGALDGDVNADGQVGIGDIVAITNYMAGMANGVTLEQADVNGDGEVGIGDIVAITNMMAGIQ